MSGDVVISRTLNIPHINFDSYKLYGSERLQTLNLSVFCAGESWFCVRKMSLN